MSPSHVWRFLPHTEKGLLPPNSSPTFGPPSAMGSAAGVCCDVSPSSTFPGLCSNLKQSIQGNAIGYAKRNTRTKQLVSPSTPLSSTVLSISEVTVTPSDLANLGLYGTPPPTPANPSGGGTNPSGGGASTGGGGASTGGGGDSTSSKPSKKLSKGAIAGIVIGVLVGLSLLSHLSKKKSKKGATTTASTTPQPAATTSQPSAAPKVDKNFDVNFNFNL